MSVSGKKEFDVKQILRLRWRWFGHSSQTSAGNGGYIQQEGFEHGGTPIQSRLKSHSRDRGGLRKSNSPVHSILSPTSAPTPVYVRTGSQSWHQQNIIQHLQASEESPKNGCLSSAGKENGKINQDNLQSNPQERPEEEATDR
ncbi:kelch-like protein 4 isoform X1 [Tachysurus ichikawai]